VEPCDERLEDEGEAEDSGAFSMKELAGELRWINNLDQALERRILVEVRRIEDRYFDQIKATERKRGKLEETTGCTKEDTVAHQDIVSLEELPNNTKEHTKVHQTKVILEEPHNHNEELMVEERASHSKVEDLTHRLLNKRRRRGHHKSKARIIDYCKLKVFNVGYMSHDKGVVEEWTTNWLPPTEVTEGPAANRRFPKARRRKVETSVEQ